VVVGTAVVGIAAVGTAVVGTAAAPPTKEEVYAIARDVCLLARLLKNACTDLDEILRVNRCRDMDALINF